ncbi:hypothetical protein IM725_06110 [Ramlibacter aquaticus]|uniref:Magnesium transporter MgtE intracellular domain-containing protein n=1 Tax=Ramlibacter aquaticus TaxID=2780094 RepID=A0ABR9SCW8_9BURK|nr:hypothetical protein [Ramlibacter aquaticus]MBE7940141.1 hypothetical protein [Ramlibacter aquaticus]
MLFRFSRARDALRRAVLAAIAAHRLPLVRELLAAHGHPSFAAALSRSSPRVVADALSMLPQRDSSAVMALLPTAARQRFIAATEPERANDAVARSVNGGSLQGLLAWSVQR